VYNIWDNVLASIEQKVSSDKFTLWFKDTSLISNEDGHVVIGVKNAFFEKMLSSKFYGFIEAALKDNNINPVDITFKTSSQDKTKSKVRAREVTTSVPTPIKKVASARFSSNNTSFLKPEYTLDNFIVGSNNDLAVAAAKSIIDAPGTRFNPFFLYGGPGLGKTHLVQAIGNALLQKDSSLKILYMPTSEFYNDFIVAVRNSKGDEFHKRFQKLDCLILDDFQQIIGKEKSQDEFFNIFNTLYQLNKQIIVTSDRLPSQIETLDPRLSSRLAQGGAYDLQLPKFEDKCAILRAKADLAGAEIEDEAIEYIAENINTNIRDLEGELSKILLMSEVRGITPLELINSGSTSISKSSHPHPVSSKQIIDKVAKYYNITSKELCGKSRVFNIKNARQIAMYLITTELSYSTTKAANEVGLKDHTTAMHAIKKISSDIKLDFTLREQIEEIKGQIYA
jgi:chromosomal replication initiator protein